MIQSDTVLIAPSGKTANDIYHLPDPDNSDETRGGNCGLTPDHWRRVSAERAAGRRLCKECDPNSDPNEDRAEQRRSLYRAIQTGEVELPD